MENAGTWIISIASIVSILTRPWQLPEWIWAVAGGALLVLTRLMPTGSAVQAALKGTDVYFFLIGMMLLSEQARFEGLFDWLANWASRHAQGSSRRLFVLIYLSGIAVTAFLSNDATAVVLTPAIYTIVKKAGAKPAPYLFACAMIANAASFVLPISNPANLVVFDGHVPRIFSWIGRFGLPSLASIASTFLALWFWFSAPLRAPLARVQEGDREELSPDGRLTAIGLGWVVLVLMTASASDWNLGLPTFISAVAVIMLAAARKRRMPKEVLKHVAWGVVPLVAGLFVIIEAMNRAGALHWTEAFLAEAGRIPTMLGKLKAAFGVGLASNAINNLPVGLVSGTAAQSPGVSEPIRSAVLIGVDLGPNLSVTGSLATLLWLMALRREKEPVSAWAFFKLGLVAMPFALALAVCLI